MKSRRRATLLFAGACVGSVLLVLSAYSNSLDNSFHFDDAHVIEENIFIRDVRNIPRFFTDARTFSSIPTNATYRPVVSTTLAIDFWFGHGLTPRPFHITQLILLLAVGTMLAALFLALLRSIGPSSWHRWTALLAATFFCVHTGNTQPVNYISARSELLAAIGVLGAILVYVRAPRARALQLHLLPMVFGGLAKTPAVIAAPLLLGYDLLIERQLSIPQLFTRRAWPQVRAALRATAPAFAAAIALYVFVEGMNPAGQTYGGGGRLRYVLTETWVWIHYARLFVLPIGLSADTDLELFDKLSDSRILLGIVFILAMIAVTCIASARRHTRVPAFGLVWFGIALIPSSTIFPLAEVANDHRIFFPFAGLSLAAAAWLAHGCEVRAAATQRLTVPLIVIGLALSVLTAHAVGTFHRNRVWRSEETLWADVVKKNPRNGRGKMNYGLTQMALGHYARARELFIEAEQLAPNYATLEVNRAIVENALGNVAAADSHFQQALELNPRHPAPHRYYARWLIRQGRAGEAIPHLVYTLALSPADIEARHMLMSLYAARAAPELVPLAIETLRFASNDSIADRHARGVPEFRPDTLTAVSWFALGRTFTLQDRHLEAAQAYRAALVLDSTHTDARNNLGWSLAKLGFYEDAVHEFRLALQRDRGSSLVTNNLAWALGEISDARFKQAFALQQTGQSAKAVEIYSDLLATFPNWVNARYNLGYALMMDGRHAEAVKAFRQVITLQPDLSAAHLHLATCLQELGQVEEAARELQAYRAGPSMLAVENASLRRAPPTPGP